MPGLSGVETTQRRSIRGSSQIRISSSNSDPLHHRSKPDRIISPKLGGSSDRRSPRTTLSDPPPVNQKRLGSRIDYLETQLGQAQEELKSLKEQLVSSKEAKKEQLEAVKAKKAAIVAVELEPTEIKEKTCTQKPKRQEIKKENRNRVKFEISEDNLQETDVFEVPTEKVAIEDVAIESSEILESKKLPTFHELEQKDNEINELKAKLEEKEKEILAFCKENESLKNQLLEKSSEISAAKSKEEETSIKLNQVIIEFDENKNNTLQIHQKLEASESSKTALETEMKKLRIQTEQWRKAADAAAAVLSGDVDIITERRGSERCGSMDNNRNIGRAFEAPGCGYNDGFIGSPGIIDETDDVYGGSKRKGSGIKMFGDLWKKMGQK